MSLRSRLLLAVLACVAAGLVVAGVVTYVSLRSFLLERVDQQLRDIRTPVAGLLASELADAPFDLGGPRGPEAVPTGTYAQIRNPSGKAIATRVFSFSDEADLPTPRLPDPLPPSTQGRSTTFTAGAVSGSSQFRMLVERIQTGHVLIVGIPLAETQQTLSRLLGLEAVVSLAVLGVLALAAWLIVKRDLRPLENMAVTADAIAAGDLTRRVEPAEPRTEVGRLGLSLNTMLGRIEEAFAERDRTEGKLRRFLADASHELRTPLTSIRGYSEVFERAKDDPEDLALAMRRIKEESERMGVMVEELLVLARLGEGREPERAPVDLARVVHDCVNDARASAPGRAITLDRVDAADVLGDDLQLRQVVHNLLSNAVRHTPPDTAICVTLSAGDGEAVVAVADDGPGLEPDVASRVFEPFYRADESRARETGGAGLGLAIVAAVVEAHGGGVRLDTSPGAGATFTVTLPLLSAQT